MVLDFCLSALDIPGPETFLTLFLAEAIASSGSRGCRTTRLAFLYLIVPVPPSSSVLDALLPLRLLRCEESNDLIERGLRLSSSQASMREVNDGGGVGKIESSKQGQLRGGGSWC